MGWLSDLFSGGSSSSSSSSSSNNDKPSPAPTPTVIKTGTTLKTGTVLNNDDDPVVFTPKDDGGYVGQNQSTLPAATTADDDKSFGEVFSENRAAGEDTFVYKGEVYTTDLAPEVTAAPSVSYDAFGNAYDTPAAAAQADQVAEAQAAAAQNAIAAETDRIFDPRGDQIQSSTSNGAGIASLGEDDVMAQEVVGAAGQDYADSLPDFSYDFTAGDDDGSALPDSSQVAGGGWEEYFQNASTQDILNTAGSNVQLPATPKKYYDAFGNEFSTRDAAGEWDRAAEAAAAAAIAKPQNPFVDDLLNVLAGNDPLSRMMLPESAPGYFANIPVGVATGVETAVRGVADLLDARPTTNMTLERMRDMGPMNAAQEEFMIRSAGEEGQRIRQEALGPRDQTFYDATAGLTSAVDYMKDYYDKNIENYEGKENIYKNIKSYEEAAGYEPGQVDPKLLDAMQSEQGIVDSLLFGQGPGSAVRMDGSGFDPSTATQKGIEAFGTTTPGLATAMMGPAGFVAGTTYGFTQVKGELDKDTGAGIDAFYASGRLQQSPAFKSLVADGVSEADAVKTLKQRARDQSAAFAGVLGGGATALEAGLLRTGAPGMLATPVIEALQEGPGESLASNQILGSVLGFDTPLSRAEILENMTAGGLGGGGASAVAPLAGGSTQAAPVLDPSKFPTAGQPAQSNVPTSYDGAQLGDGTDPMATSMESMAAQQIIEDQVNQFGVVDQSILNRLQQSTGISMEELGAMEDSATSTRLTPDQIAAIQSAPVGDIMTTAPVSPNLADEVTGIGGGSNISVRPNSDGTITLTNPSGLQTVVESGQSLDEAIQVFDEITTPIDAQTEALKLQAQEEAAALSGARDVTSTPFKSIRGEGISSLPAASDVDAAPKVDQAPASGIETVVAKSPETPAPGTGSLDAAANTSLSTIRTRAAVGDSLEGYSAADVSGQPIGSSRPQDDLDVRGTTGGPFTNMQNEPVGSIDNAPYGEPVRRVIDNSDGTTTIQVGSRVSAEGAAGNRDNYVSAAVTLPASATDEQKAAAFREAEANWRSNYEGATTSGDIKRNAGKVLPNEDITTFKAIDKKMDADNAATEVKLSDGSTSKTVVEKDGDSKTTRKTGAAVTETDTGATVEFDTTPLEVADQAAATDQAAAEQVSLDQDVFAADQVEQEAAATAAEQAAAADAAAASETQAASTVAVSQVTDDGEDEEEVEVEVEDEVQEPGGDVTVEVDEDDTFVPVITTTDENGDTITECPEGYTMVDGPDGPLCQKSVTTTVRRQRAGAGTRAYTGLAGNRGRVSPDQRSRSNTTTTTETVDPTTRSA